MKNILITGVSSGIGEYISSNLQESEIYGISRRKPKIEKIHHLEYDLIDFSKYDELIEKIKDINFDTIIINAGIGFFDKLINQNNEDIKNTIYLNTISPILLTKKILPHLNKKTKIIFIGSISSKKFFKYGSAYQASKFGLRGFVGSIRNEIEQKVFLINPSYIETDFFKNSKIEMKYNKENSLNQVFEIIKDIIDGKEKRFEIDL